MVSRILRTRSRHDNSKHNNKIGSLTPRPRCKALLLKAITASVAVQMYCLSSTTPSTSWSSNSSIEYEDAGPIATVAYVMSLTACAPRFASKAHDPAMVLRKSIELNSYPVHAKAQYAADFWVVLPPHLVQSRCAKLFQQAGWQLQVHDLPVTPEQIAISPQEQGGEFLKKNIGRDGCCGHSELLKLHAWSMANYTAAVHLDLDTLVNRPMDELFNLIHYPPDTPQGQEARQHFVRERLATPTFDPVHPFLNMTFDHFYTKDYNMLPAGKEKVVGIQGGFFVVRPNVTVRDDIIAKIKQGYYSPSNGGWFGSGYAGHIWGGLTIQGFLAYYFDLIAKATSVELHRCKYNQIAENPRRSTTGKFPRPTPLPGSNFSKQWHDTGCRDGRESCDDVQCQTWPINDTRVFHYTYCKLPWNCRRHQPIPQCLNDRTCWHMHHAWFLVRKQVQGVEIADGETMEGFCRGEGQYIPYQAPPVNHTSTP